MRLIDSDALIEQLMKDSPDPEGVAEWIDIINKQPTVEQRHQGEWIDIWRDEVYKCSICGNTEIDFCMKYCPECGAKMK